MSILRVSSSSRENDPSVANRIPQAARNQELMKRTATVAAVALEQPSAKRTKLAPIHANIQIDPRDRFIPPRAIMDQPGAQLYLHPRPAPSRTVPDEIYRRNLGNALFTSENDPYDPIQAESLVKPARNPHEMPILRIPGPMATPLKMPPRFQPGEIYGPKPRLIINVDGGVENDFYIHPVAYCPHRDLLAICSKFQSYQHPTGLWIHGPGIGLWDFKQNSQIGLYSMQNRPSHANRPISLAFSEKGRHLVVGKQSGHLEVWNIESDQHQLKMGLSPSVASRFPTSAIDTVAVHQGRIFAGDAKGHLYLIDPKMEVIVKAWKPHNQKLCAIAFSPSGQYMATGGNDDQVVLHDANTFAEIRRIKTNSGIRALAFNPSGGHHLAIGGGHKDQNVTIVNLIDPEKKPLIIPLGSQVTNIIWEPERLITTHYDGSFRVTPFKLHGEIPFGQMVKIQSDSNRIIFAEIRETDRSLMVLSKGQLSMFSLPQTTRVEEAAASIENPFDQVR